MNSANPTVSALREDAERYREYALLVRAVHYRMADVRAWVGQVIGGLAVLAAAIVSTGILTHVDTHPSFALALAGGIVAFVAAVLAGLQSFYRFGESAEKHRVAGADYGDVAKKLDVFLAQYAAGNSADAEAALHDLSALADMLSEYDRKGPGFPGRLYDRARREQEELKRQAGGVDASQNLSPTRSLRRRRD